MIGDDDLAEVRDRVRAYLRTDDYPDGWIKPEEIVGAGAPDLILARDAWRLAERLERAERAVRVQYETSCEAIRRGEAAEIERDRLRELVIEYEKLMRNSGMTALARDIKKRSAL